MKKLVVILMMLFCAGCGAEMTEENLFQVHFVKGEKEIGDRTPEERAMAIKSRLEQIEGVIGTAVVVEGHTAIIGLRLEDGLGQERIDAIKTEADRLSKHAEVQIESTSVTTNSYIVPMIEEMERQRAH